MLHFVDCKQILLEGVTFENSPAWNLHPMCCENLILRDLNVRNPWYSQNGDGVDIESCKNVVICDCSFDVGDDAICMKSGKDKPGRDRGIPTENVIVDNCVVYHGHGGFVCGSEMSGGIKNVEVRNNLYIGTDVGLRFKSTRGRGGVVENIYINGVNMVNIPNEGLLFDLFYGGKGAGEETEEELAARMNAEAPEVSEETPAFKNIVIENVTGTNIKRAIYFNGLPEMKIQNVTLRNITMNATEGAIFRQTNGLVIDNVNIETKQGEPFVLAPTVENVTRN
jgi:polygalacturonase